MEAMEPTKTAATADQTGRCFLCGEPLHPERGEPIEPAEGLELCNSCGLIYASPGGGC